MSRNKILEVYVKYEKDDGTESNIEPLGIRERGTLKYTALFWEETTIQNILDPYYELMFNSRRKVIKHTDSSYQKIRKCSNNVLGRDVRGGHMKELWNCDYPNGKKPTALLKLGKSPTDTWGAELGGFGNIDAMQIRHLLINHGSIFKEEIIAQFSSSSKNDREELYAGVDVFDAVFSD